MKKAILLVSTFALMACNYPKGDISRPKFNIGDKVKLQGIKIPDFTPPMTIEKRYWQDGFTEWFYDGHDAKNHAWEHLEEYQVTKF